jgi:hypothetical protein
VASGGAPGIGADGPSPSPRKTRRKRQSSQRRARSTCSWRTRVSTRSTRHPGRSTPRRWWRVYEIKVLGVHLCCRAVIPGMLERGCGWIVIRPAAGRTYRAATASRCTSNPIALPTDRLTTTSSRRRPGRGRTTTTDTCSRHNPSKSQGHVPTTFPTRIACGRLSATGSTSGRHRALPRLPVGRGIPRDGRRRSGSRARTGACSTTSSNGATQAQCVSRV